MHLFPKMVVDITYIFIDSIPINNNSETFVRIMYLTFIYFLMFLFYTFLN